MKRKMQGNVKLELTDEVQEIIPRLVDLLMPDNIIMIKDEQILNEAENKSSPSKKAMNRKLFHQKRKSVD